MTKQRLHAIIRERSYKTGQFTLASGETSSHFFDLKPTLLNPEGANLAAELMLEKIPKEAVAVGGLELGACPLVSAVCVRSFDKGRPDLCSFYVRKAQKERGTKQRIEGCTLKPGDKVVMMEDVTTTGGSVMEAIKAVRELGCEVIKVLSVVDRLQGARENLAKENIPLDAIFTRNDFAGGK